MTVPWMLLTQWLLSLTTFLESPSPVILLSSPVTITDWCPDHAHNVNEGFFFFFWAHFYCLYPMRIHSYAPLRTLALEFYSSWISHPLIFWSSKMRAISGLGLYFSYIIVLQFISYTIFVNVFLTPMIIFLSTNLLWILTIDAKILFLPLCMESKSLWSFTWTIHINFLQDILFSRTRLRTLCSLSKLWNFHVFMP